MGHVSFPSRYPIFILKVVMTKLVQSYQCFYLGQANYSSYYINGFSKAISVYCVPSRFVSFQTKITSINCLWVEHLVAYFM